MGTYHLDIGEVKYPQRLKRNKFFKDKTKALKGWILTKSDIWKYEDEIRAYTHISHKLINNEGFLNFDTELIKEIYIGVNNQVQIEKFVEALKKIGYKDVIINKMYLKKNEFGIYKRIRDKI